MIGLIATSSASTTLLAVITFVHPAMLAGLCALALPIAIHLISRGLPRTVVFPTIRFLSAASASQSRLHRVRHLILMVLRCAFVALLALAFARPQWFASADAAADSDRDTVAIVLLDVSASMGYADSPVSTMSQAVTQAAAVVDSLEPVRGDRANVVLVGVSPQAMYARPTSNLAAIKAQLEAVQPTAERANAGAAVALAAGQLAEFGRSRRELHIVSDLQRTNWAGVDFAPVPADTKIVFHRVGREALRPNACVTSLAVTPPQPIAGQACQVSVGLASYSDAPDRRDVILRADDGREWRRHDVALTPGAPVSVSFDVPFDKPGVHELTAEITPDPLVIDDRRFASVHVTARLPVVLCTDADLREGVTSGYLLARALAPFPDERGTIELRIVRCPELSAATLTGTDVVLLDASGPLSSDGVRALHEFLEQGGGVAVFLGFGAAAENLAALNEAAPRHDVLPFEVAEVADRPSWVVVGPAGMHPLLRPLGDVGTESLQGVSVYRHFVTRAGSAAGGAAVSFDTGDVAMAAKPVGAGRLLVCNISPDPKWSDLAKHAVFPGLIHQFVDFLRPRQWTAPSAYAGMPVTRRWLASDPSMTLEISDPRGQPVRAAIRRDGPAAVATLPPAGVPGFYRVRANGKLVESVPVNVDPAESDLAGVDMKAVQPRMAALGRAVSSAAIVGDAMGLERHGRPLWPWALAAGLLALAIEMACLMVWRR